MTTNEQKISVIFQKIQKSKIEILHGRNPEKVLSIYRYAENNILLSAGFISYSVGDTDLIVNLYFDEGSLIKGTAISFDLDKKAKEYKYYFNDNELINKEVGSAGIFRGDYFTRYAARLLKELKKRPIRFPE